MIAAFFELNDSFAAVTSLPALVLCHLNETIGLFVIGTLSPSMEFAIAQNTNLRLALTTARIFHARRQVHPYLSWFNPLPTSFPGAVCSISCSVFLVFLVPQLLELVVEETLHIFEGYVFC